MRLFFCFLSFFGSVAWSTSFFRFPSMALCSANVRDVRFLEVRNTAGAGETALYGRGNNSSTPGCSCFSHFFLRPSNLPSRDRGGCFPASLQQISRQSILLARVVVYSTRFLRSFIFVAFFFVYCSAAIVVQFPSGFSGAIRYFLTFASYFFLLIRFFECLFCTALKRNDTVTS